MKEYIERAAAIERFTVAEKEADCPGVDFTVIKRMLSDIPAADVVEVKHGRWLLDGRCSECLANPLTTHKNYCPNCGAFMQEEGNGEK